MDKRINELSIKERLRILKDVAQSLENCLSAETSEDDGCDPYRVTVESIAKMCAKYEPLIRLGDKESASDFLANVKVKCREAEEYDKMHPRKPNPGGWTDTDFGIDGLWHAQRILEKTLGTVFGYETDDGILAHRCAIDSVEKLREKINKKKK